MSAAASPASPASALLLLLLLPALAQAFLSPLPQSSLLTARSNRPTFPSPRLLNLNSGYAAAPLGRWGVAGHPSAGRVRLELGLKMSSGSKSEVPAEALAFAAKSEVLASLSEVQDPFRGDSVVKLAGVKNVEADMTSGRVSFLVELGAPDLRGEVKEQCLRAVSEISWVKEVPLPQTRFADRSGCRHLDAGPEFPAQRPSKRAAM